MGYTHIDVSAPNNFAVGKKGSEVAVAVEEFILNATITDISTSNSNWVVSPYACTIDKIYTVNENAITTAANAAITFEIGGTAITDSAITIGGATAEAASGAVDSSTPTALNTLTAGQAVEILTDGGSTNASKAEVTLVCSRT